jgi:hypothetical protein
MARPPLGDSKADRPAQAREEEVLHGPGSSKSAIDEESRWLRAVICLVALVIGVIVIFQIYRIRRHEVLSAHALGVGETFIHSSPVVEEDLGTVKAVKETRAVHHTSPAPGWYVDFDVLGKRKSGVVEMRLHKANDEWHVPSAKLKIGHTEVVSLR